VGGRWRVRACGEFGWGGGARGGAGRVGGDGEVAMRAKCGHLAVRLRTVLQQVKIEGLVERGFVRGGMVELVRLSVGSGIFGQWFKSAWYT
jgi:hypothetical protein